MSKWILSGENSDVGLRVYDECSTLEELEAVVPRALARAAASGSILDLESPSGKILSFAIAGDNACANFVEDIDAGPYLTALGEPARSRTDGVVAFRYGGDESEIPLRNCIRPDQVLPVVREFFDRDARPTSIEWEEV
jgi:Immunity protein Imm1